MGGAGWSCPEEDLLAGRLFERGFELYSDLADAIARDGGLGDLDDEEATPECAALERACRGVFAGG